MVLGAFFANAAPAKSVLERKRSSIAVFTASAATVRAGVMSRARSALARSRAIVASRPFAFAPMPHLALRDRLRDLDAALVLRLHNEQVALFAVRLALDLGIAGLPQDAGHDAGCDGRARHRETPGPVEGLP